VKFDVDELVDAISLGKTIGDVTPMFRGAATQVARNPGVARAATATCENVDARLHFERIMALSANPAEAKFVVPAKAGTQKQATEIPGFPLSRE
jgi:hypothetical protein